MNRSKLSGFDWTAFVNGLADHINDSSKTRCTDGHHDGVTSILDGLTSDETFRGVQSDGSYVVSTQMLGNFKDQSMACALNFESVENWRQVSLKLDIDDGADDLRDFSICDFLSAKGTYSRMLC